jgi:hypothetical protein
MWVSIPYPGSSTELEYSLLTFGISAKGILESGAGEEAVKSKLMQKYNQDRREIEKRKEEAAAAEEATSETIAFPTQKDVLLGRGRPYPEFPGNIHLDELVDGEVRRYKECRHQFEKTRIILDAIKAIQDSGGRFLKRSEDGWEVVRDESIIVKKVGGVFRTRPQARKRLKVDPSLGK